MGDGGMILDVSSMVPAVSFVIYIPFALFGLYHRKKEKTSLPFLLYMSFMALWSFGSFMMHANSGLLSPLFWNRIMLVGLLGGPISVFYSMIELSGAEKRRYRFLLFTGAIFFPFMLYLNFSGKIVSGAGFEDGVFYYNLGEGAFLVYFLCYSYLIMAFLPLLGELRKSNNIFTKKTLRLVILGVVVMLVGVLVNLYSPLGRYPIDLFAATINAGIVFFAVYKYRLVHYSAVVMKILLFIFLSIITGIIFFMIFWIGFRSNRELSDQTIFLVSTLLAITSAIIFYPLRTGALTVMEKLYAGKSFGYYQGLKRFSASLTSIVDLENLGDLTIDKVIDS
jgi:hypothetical protein